MPHRPVTSERTTPVKITRPAISTALRRNRLFNLLDSGLGKPVIWISAPAGSGKTTLVSGWLERRKAPCIWYRCDEGDADPATFFYYLGLAAKKAAPRRRKPLPLLTPEYFGSVRAFAGMYFEELYLRLLNRRSVSAGHDNRGFFIVLDNYHCAPEASPFHDMIAAALDLIPEGIHFVVISRSEPPPVLARLRSESGIAMIGYCDIRFTLEESAELVRGRSPELDDQAVRAMHENTQGWAAGIILMLERGGTEGVRAETAAGFASEKVFDYFAGEIFNRTEKRTREFLLKTSFLSALSAQLAEKLTGITTADSIISALNRNHYFIEKLAGGARDYQYHPLFRYFLMNRAAAELPAAELSAVRRKAARLLDEAGQTEDSAKLYRDSGDREGLTRLVMAHARELLMQGRNKTLEEWLAAIPAEQTAGQPWLLFWSGMCAFPLDMPRARGYLEKALEAFRAAGDASGVYLSWAGAVDTYAYELGEWKSLDGFTGLFEELRKTYPAFPTRDIELVASSRMLMALTMRNTDQPERVEGWLEAVSTLLQENPSFDIQMDILFSMSLYYLWKGSYNSNAILLERAGADISRREPPPFVVIRVKMMQGIHYWITAQYEAALKTLSEGLEIAMESGVHVFDSMLWSFTAAAEMAPGRLGEAEQALANQRASMLDMNGSLNIYFYHINAAWYSMLRGDPSPAIERLETLTSLVERMGTPYYRALWKIGLAQALFLQGRAGEAKERIEAAGRISLDMKSPVMEWYSLLVKAWFLIEEGREGEGLIALRAALALGKKHGYVHLEFYLPGVMRTLYAKALDNAIETEYVKRLIRKLGLTPPDPSGCPADWPFPVRIYTLGRFELLKDGEQLLFAGKAQKKPLELLKAIIAFGGEEVSAQLLTDTLWPDAEGDLAHKSFETTLARLRRLLGSDRFIRHSNGQVTIDLLYCRVDSMELDMLLEAFREAPAGQAALLCGKAIGLYKGHFLPADSSLAWTASCRETLRNRLLRAIAAAGRYLEEDGRWDRAAEYYRRGIEADDLAELFYQRLMICYSRLGSRADAVRMYNLCRDLLRSGLGIEPSAETEAIYASVIR
jgi:ATP/maltotriose-dependent transcriptional regulator MalT/DNA-binding SARP family transcriptional activator